MNKPATFLTSAMLSFGLAAAAMAADMPKSAAPMAADQPTSSAPASDTGSKPAKKHKKHKKSTAPSSTK